MSAVALERLQGAPSNRRRGAGSLPAARRSVREALGTVGEVPGAIGEATEVVGEAAGAVDEVVEAVGGELTLDAVLVGVWEALAAHQTVRCPICAEAMTPEYGAHARPIGGSCGSCATRLG